MNTEHNRKSSTLIPQSEHEFQSIGIIGAGAWGTALACCAKEAGREVRMWAREDDIAQSLSAGSGNPTFLPGVDLPALPASSDMSSLAECDGLLIVVPAQHLATTFRELRKSMTDGTPVALCAKGIVQDGVRLPTDVLEAELPNARPAVLSGPSFAIDVARGLPTAVTLACPDRALGEKWATAIGRPHFRIYWTDDMIGAEIGGAIKNVLAIACGACEGLGLGKSAHAALIARGFAEMTRLGAAMNARPETLAGLSGLGDLVLTCSSPQSRNMSFGFELGRGRPAAEVLKERLAVTEGASSAPAVVELAKRHQVDMPICEIVNRMVAGKTTAKEAMQDLLNRPFREESQ